jgi:hypothetical protein
MRVLSPNQELLAEYLAALGMPLIERLLTAIELWEEEATMEMLRYIAETGETDWKKLSKISAEISRKYDRDDEAEDCDEYLE